MPIERDAIVIVAHPARVALTEDEINPFSGQLSIVLDAVEQQSALRPAS